jgi:hypothetical protein
MMPQVGRGGIIAIIELTACACSARSCSASLRLSCVVACVVSSLRMACSAAPSLIDSAASTSACLSATAPEMALSKRHMLVK